MMKLIQGDCLEVLKTLDENSVDSLVCDPPAGIAFMGKDWDKDKGGRTAWVNWMTEVMRECHRVMKPGAHGFVWALPRTSHWTAWALEEAGFEIRDSVHHLFGSGFPKSLDVSKAIDKMYGAERDVVGYGKLNPRDKKSYEPKAKNEIFDRNKGMKKLEITAPSTPEAKQWNGFGTALKPAHEVWWLVRKPLSEKTVAKNVLRYGTGALNIDASRVEAADQVIHPTKISTNKHEGYQRPWNKDPSARERADEQKRIAAQKCNEQGRFPANLIVSGDAREVLDEQSGLLKNGGQNKTSPDREGMFGVRKTQIGGSKYVGDSGGASRFFFDGADPFLYCAKARIDV